MLTGATPAEKSAAPASTDLVAIRAERRGARTVLAQLRGSQPWHPRPLAPEGPVARVALVQATASLLAGDSVALRVEVGPGAALELVELGATLTHRGDRGAIAISIEVTVGSGGRLLWPAQPLVLGHGCEVRRRCRLRLAPGARALVRETLVLRPGGGGETGILESHTSFSLCDRPLLAERLRLGGQARPAAAAVIGSATVLDSLALLGARAVAAGGDSQLTRPGTLWRTLGSSASAAAAEAASRYPQWRQTALDTPPSVQYNGNSFNILTKETAG